MQRLILLIVDAIRFKEDPMVERALSGGPPRRIFGGFVLGGVEKREWGVLI